MPQIIPKVPKKFQNTELSVCFYSGLDLFKIKDAKCSIEHLIPQSILPSGYKSLDVNIVAADSKINQLVGCAPLAIKFALKKYLSKLEIITLPYEKLLDVHRGQTELFLSQYKIDRVYPWDWHTININNPRLTYREKTTTNTSKEVF